MTDLLLSLHLTDNRPGRRVAMVLVTENAKLCFKKGKMLDFTI